MNRMKKLFVMTAVAGSASAALSWIGTWNPFWRAQPVIGEWMAAH
jgi:hypothetical protein